MEQCFIHEAGARTGEGDPLVVRRPGEVALVPRRTCEPFQSGSIRSDRVDLVIFIAVADECDSIPVGGPCREVVSIGSTGQFCDSLGGNVNSPQTFVGLGRSPVNQPFAIGRSAGKSGMIARGGQHSQSSAIGPDQRQA
jgi:hypothetical protein